VRKERVVLKDESEVAVLGVDLVDPPLANKKVAGGDGLEPGDHPQRRRLAAAGGAEQDQKLAILDLEVDAVHGDDIAAIDLRDVAQADIGHQTSDRMWR
jgi:hypothetical protein